VIHPRIKHRLSKARTTADAQAVWRDHYSELSGYTFVLSEPDRANRIQVPARVDFPGGGHLRSAFAHDSLYFISHDILTRTVAEGVVHIPVDYSVGFDANVATYVRSWHKGRTETVVTVMQGLVRRLREGRMNWDTIPYLLERSDDILQQRDLTEIYETELASQWLSAADRTHLGQSGETRLRFSESELAMRAQRALADWDHLLKNGHGEVITRRFALCHACVLMMALLHLEEPSAKAAPAKLQRFLEFLDTELQTLLLLFVRVAMEFFAKGSACKPLAKISSRSPRLRQHVRNVTWDFMHLIWRHEFAGFNGRLQGFLVPYFLTFDAGLAELFELYPQRSCLFGGELGFPLFFPDTDFEALFPRQYPQLAPIFSRIFSPQASERRRQKGASAPVVAIVADLERQLVEFENLAVPLKPPSPH
jgi:hypothetical protein